MAAYPALFERYSEVEILVTFRDLPECMTSGVDEPEALSEAQDALETAILSRIDDGRNIPMPSGLRAGERYVEIDLVEALATWRSLGCSLCRRISSYEDLQRYFEDGTIPDRSAECDHPIMRNRDEVEARYRRVIIGIEEGDDARVRPAAADGVVAAGR